MAIRRSFIIASFALTVSLAAAGCGGGGRSPGVANLASPPAPGTTTTHSSSGPPLKALLPSGSNGRFKIGMAVGTSAAGEKFSECMRKHGVPNFPDPNAQGVITIESGEGIDPGSPAFTSARTVCMKVLPNGGQPTPAQIAQRQQQMLKLSACMRAHGIKDFPDPSNGGLTIQVHPGSDLDPSNPTYEKAAQACRQYLPFKGGALKG